MSVRAPRKGSAAEGTPLERAHRRLQDLYEISKVLSRFAGVEGSVSAVIAILGGTLPLRSAVCLVEYGPSRVVTWFAEDLSPRDRRAHEARARAAYGYLSGVGSSEAPRSQVDPEESGPDRFVVLPLVMEDRRVFGVFQLACARAVDELDLVFVNAAVIQLAIAVDRDARIAARQLTTERELEFARAVTASLGDGVFAVDLDGRVTFANPTAEQMLGYAIDESLGKRIEDVLVARTEDGATVSVRESLAEAMRARAPVSIDGQLFEARGRLAFPVSYTSTPLLRAHDLVGAVLVFHDITEARRRAEEARLLQQLGARLSQPVPRRETLLAIADLAVPFFADVGFVDERSPDGSFCCLEVIVRAPDLGAPDLAEIRDALLQATRASARWTPYVRALESQQPVLHALLADDDSDDHEISRLLREHGVHSALVVPLVARGQILGMLTFLLASPGRSFSVADLALIEGIARTTALAIDNATLYAQAQAAVRSREELLAIVSHDLRSPLLAIRMATNAMMRLEVTEPVRGNLRKLGDSLQRSAGHMTHLIGDLVDLASIDAGRLSVELGRHEVGQILVEAVEAQRPVAAEKSLRFDCETPAGDVEVVCDRDRVLQVLSNLLGNAVKFTPPGGSITVRATPRGDAVLCTVSDTGPGLTPEEISHVFDRYWQATRTGRLGVGLGLAISKAIIESLGGHLWAHSEKGKGSTFCFTLLRAEEHPTG